MMNIRLAVIKSVLIFIISAVPVDLAASGFLSAGSGGVAVGTYDGAERVNNPGIPFILGFQYSPEYRESWMFDSSFSYVLMPGDDSSEDVYIGTAGIMYVKPFYFYKSNVTEKVFRKNSCLGMFLLPVTVMRDAFNNFFQLIIPQHPFAFFDLALIKESGSVLRSGFSTGAGLTTGGVDIRLRYTQNVRYKEGLKRDIYITGIEFTFNFPLQEQFLRTEPFME